MESTDTQFIPEAVKTEDAPPLPPPPPPPPPPSPPPLRDYFALDAVLRVILFAATLISVVVMTTAKETEYVSVLGVPLPLRLKAKFNYSPAFIYFVAALSVACLWSILSSLASLSVISKPAYATNLQFYYIILDVLMLGIVAAATGAAGGVAYIGLRGNKHSGWVKLCPYYDNYCRHIGASIALSLFASVLLLLLTYLSVVSLKNRVIPPTY